VTAPERVEGVIHGAGGGVYLVRIEGGKYVEAVLRGRLKRVQRTGDKVVIGDRVGVCPSDDAWVIEAVEDRETEIVRRAPGSRAPKVIAANLDRVLVVVAAREPDPSLTALDRLLVIVEWSGLHPVLVVNKIDLDPTGESVDRLAVLYRDVGYRVLPVSAASGTGMEDFTAEVCTGSSALLGPSGVGKSSLLNALDPGLRLRTGELSRKTGRGRQTTVSSRLISLECGGLVADTPGFGDVALWSVDPAVLQECFPDILRHTHLCRFRGCSHLTEPDCAVREALSRGELAESRYRSFAGLRREATAGL
jgi:ribosome biogenesis GTPase